MDTPLTDELIKGLLYEDEGAALDFKRAPYPFEGADDRQKSELLKDVLAFANAFRRTTAYVLIGVEEIPGGRGIVRGVDHHPDDAALQQFVNSKTNRPVTFHYRAREVDGKQVGVIEIPVQNRPLYLLKAYGRLQANAVYVRRGSSTEIASLDEVSQMGSSAGSSRRPELVIAVGDAESDERFGNDVHLACTSYKMPGVIPNYERYSHLPGGYAFSAGPTNSSFYRDFAKHERDHGLLAPVHVVVENKGAEPLIDGRVVMRFPKDGSCLVAEEREDMPDKGFYLPQSIHDPAPDWTVAMRGTFWEATTELGSVHPGGSAWTGEVFLGGTASGDYPLEISLLGANLPEPLRLDVMMHLDVTEVRVPLDVLTKWADQGYPPPELCA